jgi:hypothetical protein
MKRGVRYLVRIANSDHMDVSQYTKVRERLKGLLEQERCIINSSRISGTAIEVDYFAPDRAAAEESAAILSGFGSVLTVKCLSDENTAARKREDVMEEARALFNEERFWEVHEVVEGEWKKAEGREKEILQGIILYAAAYVHHQKNEEETALRMLRRAAGKLGCDVDRYFCFDLSKMREMERSIAREKRIRIFRL